jgi:uncharacterized protein (DUF362 family)
MTRITHSGPIGMMSCFLSNFIMLERIKNLTDESLWVDSRSRVALRRHGAPADMVYDALQEISPVPDEIQNKVVLVKPNAGFLARQMGTGLVTNSETVRGAIRFFRDGGAAKVLVGDGSIAGVDASEALTAAGIAAVAREEGAEPVNLDKGKPVRIEIKNPMAVDAVKISSIALEADLIVSMPVMKSHMNTVASLGIKNMKGCLLRHEKQRFHHLVEEERFRPWHQWKTLERAIADLYSVLRPAMVVMDGIVAMEGMGPSMGSPKPMGLVIASNNALAAELAGLYIMGLHWREVPHVFLAAQKVGVDLSEEISVLNIDRGSLDEFRSPFARAVPEDVARLFPSFRIIEGDACSACCATVMAFLKQKGQAYEGRRKGSLRIALGKNINPNLIDEGTILLGNCTAELRGRGRFLPGCPPIGSDIEREIARMDEEGSLSTAAEESGETREVCS